MLEWFESDGTTPLASLAFGKVGPGETYSLKHSDYLQIVLKNTDSAYVDDVTIELDSVGTYTLNEYVLFAVGATEPDASEFVAYTDYPWDVGTLAAGESVNVWLDLVVPAEAPRARGQLARLRAVALEGS